MGLYKMYRRAKWESKGVPTHILDQGAELGSFDFYAGPKVENSKGTLRILASTLASKLTERRAQVEPVPEIPKPETSSSE